MGNAEVKSVHIGVAALALEVLNNLASPLAAYSMLGCAILLSKKLKLLLLVPARLFEIFVQVTEAVEEAFTFELRQIFL